MAINAVGLKTQIWNNNFKSILLLAGFPFLIFLMIWAFHYAMAYGRPDAMDASMEGLSGTWHWALIGAGVWFVIAWFNHQRMIEKAAGSRGVTRQEEPHIYNMMENLCISRGLPMPKLAIMDTPALNAFASGISNKTYTVTLTRGIIETLDDDELEAVIGHELTHITNKDVRLLIISVIFVGMISFFAEMMFRNMMYGRPYRMSGRDNRSGGGGKGMLVAMVIFAVGYLFAILIRFALSRRREYLADAGAVQLTKKPEAMISALEKIAGNAKMESVTPDIAQMCIENPPSFTSIFATHPPIEKRIEALRKYNIYE